MTVNQCPVFISSSDAYSDIWDAFFFLFRKNWPEYSGTIYLNTEHMDYSYPGLKIVSTKVGTQKAFGETFKAGIEQVPGTIFLFMMIDYFVEKKVDVDLLEELYSRFRASDSETLILFHHVNLVTEFVAEACCRIVPPGGESIFSFQTAFWRKDQIAKYIADWESPWYAEYFGCRRANCFKSNFWMLGEVVQMPIKYHPLGVLHGGGKWFPRALSEIDMSDVPIDLKKSLVERGVWKEPRFPRLVRIPKEIRLLPLRIRSMLSIQKLKKALAQHNVGGDCESSRII